MTELLQCREGTMSTRTSKKLLGWHAVRHTS